MFKNQPFYYIKHKKRIKFKLLKIVSFYCQYDLEWCFLGLGILFKTVFIVGSASPTSILSC